MSRITNLLILLLLAATFTAEAQTRRVVTYKTVTVNRTIIDVSAFIYEAVDEQPQFPGGDIEMMRFINHEREYPKEAYDSGIEGRVVCSFIVNPNGEITNPEILRGVEESLDKEAIRIIEKMPKWEAGKIDGINVPVYYILTIPFRR